ncbi:MAG: T9SS type A sorting domain-containing protein, partial [Bacteroidetes bacterium]|nr:T9SS type A sorting domain-containing protein [Bacteroidota bacterium]
TFNSMCFPTQNTGYVLGDQGFTFIKTTDGGLTWIDMASPTEAINGSYHAFYFTSEDTGYFCGDFGYIIKTMDGGNTYSPLNSSTTQDLYSMAFINKNTGFAGSSSGTILKTMDGGNTWIEKHSGAFYGASRFLFLDSLHGYCLGSRIEYLKTDDGGETWTPVLFTLSNYNFGGMFFTDPDTGYLVGENGMIFKITNGGIYTGTQYRNPEADLKILPNPNDGNFVVDLPIQSENISVQLFDLSGVRIFTAMLPCQSGKVELKLSAVKSGIYILKIISTSKVHTGKIIIR